MSDEPSSKALEIMDSIAYDGPLPIVVSEEDIENLSVYERHMLNMAAKKAVASGSIRIEYSYATRAIIIAKA